MWLTDLHLFRGAESSAWIHTLYICNVADFIQLLYIQSLQQEVVWSSKANATTTLQAHKKNIPCNPLRPGVPKVAPRGGEMPSKKQIQF